MFFGTRLVCEDGRTAVFLTLTQVEVLMLMPADARKVFWRLWEKDQTLTVS